MFLNRVVSQMDEQVVELAKVVLLPGHPNVTLLKEVAFVLRCHKDPESDVKLALGDQKWFLNILL